ncbi:hypothetical protein M8J76_007888 [Diaphorina citri]|nr:hypothetical protein M8J76_007888 [Diaphorina citri]
MEVVDYQPRYVAGLGKLRKKCTPIPVPPPRVPSPMPPPGFKRASLSSTATGLAPSPPPVKKGQSRSREFNEDISEPWINPRILLKINKEKLLQTISPALGEEDRKIPSQVNGGQNNVLSFKTEKSAVESRSKPLLCYQKPSSPVTCLARTRKIQVIQSIASDHSVNDAENIPRHGGSQLSCREDIQISSNRDLTASTSKNMETNVLENYKLMFRNKIRVFENADANHSHNQNNSQCKGSNKTVSTKPFAENFRQMDKSNAYSLKENNSSHKTNESTNAGDSYSSENNFKSNFNKIGSNITKEFSDREQSSFKSVIHQDLRDGNFRDKFKASRPHLNEFSNADAMYKVSKVYPPSSYTLTQMTTSVAVEFFAR